jgi:hypothetical protein
MFFVSLLSDCPANPFHFDGSRQNLRLVVVVV